VISAWICQRARIVVEMIVAIEMIPAMTASSTAVADSLNAKMRVTAEL